MKSILFFICTFLLFSSAFCQPETGLIIGNKIEIRSQGFSMGSVVKSVNGFLPVKILEVSKEVDGKEFNNRCETFPWVKVSWKEDSTGWVRGKFLYAYTPDPDFITSNFTFIFKNETYTLMTFLNYSYPPWDAEGPTDCNYLLHVYLYDQVKNIYFPIFDERSRTHKTGMTILYNYEIREKIIDIKTDGHKIYLTVKDQQSDIKAANVYTIEMIGETFKITS